MKTIKKSIFIIACILQVILSVIMLDIKNTKAYNGSAEIVMDQSSGRVLYGNNVNQKMFMASTTKILTAITVIENFDINSKVIVKKETCSVEGSSIYLEPGEVLTRKELLYGLMLRSGNDCAETLAVDCSNSIEEFVKLMNEMAKKIGATNSNFVNPHGLHNENHYTTAYDLALISRYAMKNQVFREIVSTKKISIPFSTRDFNRVLINKNKLLNRLDGCIGVKTGFTKKAGRCLVTSCKRNGLELICVVLNCQNMFEHTEYLLLDAFSNYNSYKIFNKNNIIDFLEVKNCKEKCPIYIKSNVKLALTEKEKENLKIVYDFPNILEKNYNKDEEIGSIKFFIENNLIFTEKVYTINSVENF
ncbi:MAG: D-alanyl-D-alanine carboxypeptidase [Clostridia bacterium]|nr:D-alanyl-D-alanine carboxypeptidase [Clostridia bacterium]